MRRITDKGLYITLNDKTKKFVAYCEENFINKSQLVNHLMETYMDKNFKTEIKITKLPYIHPKDTVNNTVSVKEDEYYEDN